MSVIQIFEVDVFEHPRFYHEFSLLMNRHLLASEIFLGNSPFNLKDLREVVIDIRNCHTSYISLR